MDEEDSISKHFIFSTDAKPDFNFTLISWIHTNSKQSSSTVMDTWTGALYIKK